MMSERQTVSLVCATELGCGLTDFQNNLLKLSKLLQRAASTLNSAPQQIALPWQASPHPTLLAQSSPTHNVRLLALGPPCWHPQHPSPDQRLQLPVVDRGKVYAATLLQHAACLLLLLVSDNLLLLIPGTVIPPHILQLLHVLPKVRQQLLHVIHARQKHTRPTKATKIQLQPHEPEQQQQSQAGGSSPDDPSIPTDNKPEQQYEHLLQLLQKPATQLHIALQVSTIAEASISVQQAEHTILKCKAAVAAQRTSPSADSSKTPVAGTTVRSNSLLFELAGVHACSDDTYAQSAVRRAVLRTIQQQLFNTSVLQQQLLEKEQQQQQQLPTVDMVLASLAATAATTDSISIGSLDELQQLWQQLLQLLFPAAASNSGSSSSSCYPFYQQITLQADDAASDDSSADSADDTDWDEGDDSWQEVTQHAESADEGGADSARAPGELLTSALDPLYVMSSKRCAVAARAALRAYLQAVPARYTATAHESAVGSALLQYQTAASGPAADDVQHQLQQACVAVWQCGRQQCSAVSLTGRPCTQAPHDVAKVPHSSGASFVLAAPDGSEQQQQQHDWFNFDDANVQPVQQLLQQQQQRSLQHQAGTADIISAVVKLLLPGDPSQDTAGTSSSRQQHHIRLGSWFSLWHRRSEPAAAASGPVSSAVTLPGQRWLPGFNKLLQLRVLGSSHAAATTAEASDADEGTSEDGQPDPAAVVAAAGPADSIHILEGILEGINIKGSRGRARRRGRGARGAAAGAAGSDPWSDALATSGKRGGKAKVQQPLVAPTAATLGPEDFPTLSEAATGTKKNLAGDHLQQQQPAEVGSAVTQARGRERHKRRDAGSAERLLQQQLIHAWDNLDKQQSMAGSITVPSTYMTAASSNKSPGPAAAGVSGPVDASSARRGRGRGHRGAAAVAAATDKPSPAHVTPAADQTVMATLWIGLEYESLCGVRAVLTPTQLLTTVQQQEQQRQQEQITATAAAVAAASAARNLPGSRGQGRGRARGGRSQRQQHREGSSTALQSPQLLADSTSSSSSSSSSSSGRLGAEQLVLQDIPLFIHPAAAGPTDVESASASAATAVTSTAAAKTAAAAPDTQLLQLKRIYVRTPPAPFMFASHPRVVFTAAAAASAAGSGVSSMGANAAGESSDQGSSSSIIELSSCDSIRLPTDSLSVLSLPQIYGAPSGWVRAVAPAAAAAVAVAAAAVDVASVSAAAGTAAGVSCPDTADCSSISSTAASGGVAAEDHLPAEVGDIRSTASTSAAAARPISCSEVEGSSHAGNSNLWLPLIPVKSPSTDADSSYPATSSQAAAVASSGKGGSSPSVPGPWSAYLCGGSWLHPVALQQR